MWESCHLYIWKCNIYILHKLFIYEVPVFSILKFEGKHSTEDWKRDIHHISSLKTRGRGFCTGALTFSQQQFRLKGWQQPATKCTGDLACLNDKSSQSGMAPMSWHGKSGFQLSTVFLLCLQLSSKPLKMEAWKKSQEQLRRAPRRKKKERNQRR